jgi:hypothetical protein
VQQQLFRQRYPPALAQAQTQQILQPDHQQQQDAAAAIPGASPSFIEHGGHSNEMLAFAERHMHSFDQACRALVADMRACAWCGRFALGGEHCALWKHYRKRHSKEAPRGLLANPNIIPLASHPAGSDWYWACQTCGNNDSKGDKRREKQQHWQVPVIPDATDNSRPAMDKWRELFGMLLSLPAGAGLQLSVLQSSVRFMQNLRSYVHAMQPDEQACLLSGPLVNWSMEEVG